MYNAKWHTLDETNTILKPYLDKIEIFVFS